MDEIRQRWEKWRKENKEINKQRYAATPKEILHILDDRDKQLAIANDKRKMTRALNKLYNEVMKHKLRNGWKSPTERG